MRVSRSFLLGLGVVLLLGAGVALSQTIATPAKPAALRLPANYQPTPPAFLADAAAGVASAPDDPVAKGRYLAVAGDCVACHTAEGQAPFSGSRPLNTLFGVIYSSNLTSDVKTGIGRYTPETFWRAMHEGKNAEGHNLYPAFPLRLLHPHQPRRFRRPVQLSEDRARGGEAHRRQPPALPAQHPLHGVGLEPPVLQARRARPPH